ncbi:acyl-ACP--UDP-N- acetylglucosamine O-acyltransferase [Sulfurimonas sp.]|uniref:acyl-ACP--UDP-N- acetylglucosamine O-acyltransferase n=1 Tax=Sulfurimonas sp. TaxID=2022749 RepID=UPI0025E183CC|nr:acyl-ACP--UDP-N- acetylglucosamine O-acyltransferase [Sulfurimonas sp.]
MIHETSIIEDGAKIADNVTIGPFCNISKDIELKSGCKLESNVILKGKLIVDKDVRIFSFTAIGNENSDITIGKKTHIREFVQIGSQDSEDGNTTKVTVGDENFLMGYVQLLSGCTTGQGCILTNAVRLYENVTCEDRVIVGGLSTIEAGNTIGSGVMIGGASCVDHDIPPFTLVEGNRATVKGLNVVGLRRRLKNKADIEKIKSIFKQILGEIVDKELASDIAKEHENEYAREFASFISKSNNI